MSERERLLGFRKRRRGLRADDQRKRISAVGRECTMLMCLVRTVLRGAPKHRQAALLLRRAPVMMSFSIVDQLPVLGAARVLDQEHVASARALKKQR
ncbi:MAG: hypothetical protein WBN60_15605 [Polyangiales bacterium]